MRHGLHINQNLQEKRMDVGNAQQEQHGKAKERSCTRRRDKNFVSGLRPFHTTLHTLDVMRFGRGRFEADAG